MLPLCLDRQRGMVSREYWGESLPESVRVVKETKSLWVCSRLSNRRERHFPLSERLVQDRSWWANKMIEQKELFYKDRTSVPEPIFCSLVRSKPQALCLLKMRNKALLSAVRTLTFSCHVMLRWWMGHCDDGCGYLVRSNALNTEREVHKTLQSTVHDSMIIQIFILLMKSNSRMPWNGRHVVYLSVNFKSRSLITYLVLVVFWFIW